MRKALVVALVLTGAPSISMPSDAPIEAWWLRATFATDSTEYRGVPAASIDPHWLKMGMITYEKLPLEAREDIQWMRKDHFSFEVAGNLDANGFEDVAATGVYDAQGGSSGRFLLVLRKMKDGTWYKIFLHEEAGERGFSVLVRRAGRIYWGTCMQCEEFRRLTVDSNTVSLGE